MEMEIRKLEIRTFADVWQRIGSFGLFQWIVFLSCQYLSICTAINWSFMSFGGLTPKYFCNGTVEEIDTAAANKQYCMDRKTSSCFNQTIVAPQFYSVVQEWNLVCDLDYIPALMTTGQMISQIITNLVVGPLIDAFGRKWMMFAGFLGLLAAGIINSFSVDWRMMTALFVIVGIFLGAVIQIMFTFSLELVGPKHRIPMACAFQWTLVVQVFALIAYLTGTWRKLLLVGNCICIPVLILLFLVPESPRWLVQKQRYEEALKSIKFIAKVNQRTEKYHEVTLSELKMIQVEKSGHSSILSLVTLFSTKKRVIYICWVIIAGLCIGVTYRRCDWKHRARSGRGVILFGIGDLAGSAYLNISLYGWTRVWAPLVMIGMEWKTKWFGRRLLYLSSGALVLICFSGIVIIHIVGLEDNYTWSVIKTVLAQIGVAVSVSLTFTAWNQYSIELFPTLLRGTSVGVAEMATNIGSALAPQFIYLKKFWSGTPYASVAILGIISWIYALISLPETKGKPLPDFVGEEETLDKGVDNKAFEKNDTELSQFS